MTPFSVSASSRVAVRQPQFGRPQAVPRPRLPLPMQVLGQARALQDGVESAAGEGRRLPSGDVKIAIENGH